MKRETRRAFKEFGYYSSLGISVSLAVFIGLGIGVVLDRKFDTSPCDATMVPQHYGIGRDVGLSGTPAIVFDDGTLIAGYLPPSQLAARLEQNSGQ